jgi:predicted AAA+ superfamily ATPase
MLKRKVTHYIKKWVDSKNKKCLVIQGARQTGKTYIVEDLQKRTMKKLLKLILNRYLLRWIFFPVI